MGRYVDEFTDELKLHINLSQTCDATIEVDRLGFGLYDQEISKTGFINTIFTNFFYDSKANVTEHVNNKRAELNALFSKDEYKGIDQKTLSLIKQNLLQEYKDKLIKHNLSAYDKYEGKKYRINLENIKILSDLDQEIDYADYSIGTLFKLVLEEYALLPQSERIKIYYKDIVNTLQNAIGNKHGVKLIQSPTEIDVKNPDGTYAFDEEGHNIKKMVSFKFYLKPYKVVSDEGMNYLYVIGLSEKIRDNVKDNGKVFPPKPHAFRISMIEKVVELSPNTYNGFISEEKAKEIDKLFKKNGPLMASREKDIVVQFDKKGLELFKRISFGRPKVYSLVEGTTDTYKFSCTERLASLYFWRLVPYVKIITPAKLQKELVSKAKLFAEANEEQQAKETPMK